MKHNPEALKALTLPKHRQALLEGGLYLKQFPERWCRGTTMSAEGQSCAYGIMVFHLKHFRQNDGEMVHKVDRHFMANGNGPIVTTNDHFTMTANKMGDLMIEAALKD